MPTKKKKASSSNITTNPIELRPGDSDGGDKPCLYCLRNPERYKQEYFDNGRYVCDMCAKARYGLAARY